MEERWAPLEPLPQPSGGLAERAAPQPPSLPPRSRRSRHGWAIAAAVAVLLVMVALAVVLVGGDEEPAGQASTENPDPEPAAEAEEPVSEPTAILAHATERLTASGTFAYVADGFEQSGNGQPQPRHFEGEVRLPDTFSRTMTGLSGDAVEEMRVGPELWNRNTDFPDQLALRPWQMLRYYMKPSDPTEIVGWLEIAENARNSASTAADERTIVADVPRRSFATGDMFNGPIDPEGTLELTVGGDGDPRRIVLSLADGNETIEMSYDIERLGEDMAMARPAGDTVDSLPFVEVEDLGLAEITKIGLPEPPPGWRLNSGTLTLGSPDGRCATVRLRYDGGWAESFRIAVTPAGCPNPVVGQAIGGDPLAAGGLSGRIDDVDGGRTVGTLSSDELIVQFETAGIPPDQARDMAAGLGPVDVAAQVALP